ncbi:MAG: 4Fe-4S dicluster domain-containing protein [Desulfobacteraceae bacterium]
MDIYSITYGPLLWLSFLVMIIGIVIRILFFFFSILRSSAGKDNKIKYVLSCLGRALVPYHRAFPNMPVFIIGRYLFHVVLFAVPIALGGHIILWEESRFSWSWSALPSAWADSLTIAILLMGGFFFVRRIIKHDLRQKSNIKNYFLIVITLLPFITGYMYANMELNSISFLENYIGEIHALSGELFILIIPFVFLEIKFNHRLCIGCSACTVVCPTKTLTFEDITEQRVFYYQHFQCISCGTCVHYCPESAAFLKHDISIKKMVQLFRRYAIFSTPLSQCKICGVPFAPQNQMDKLHTLLKDIHVLSTCPRCRAIRANALNPRFQQYEYGYRGLAPMCSESSPPSHPMEKDSRRRVI